LDEHFSEARARELRLSLKTQAKREAQSRWDTAELAKLTALARASGIQMGGHLQGLIGRRERRQEPQVALQESRVEEIKSIADHLAAVRTAAQLRKAHKAESYEALAAQQQQPQETTTQWASPLLADFAAEHQRQRLELERRTMYKEVYKEMDPKSIPVVWDDGGPQRPEPSTKGFLSPYRDDGAVPALLCSSAGQVCDPLTPEYYRHCLEDLPKVELRASTSHLKMGGPYATRMETLLGERLGS